MKSLVNHPGMWLRDDAADSLERLERDHGVQPVNSAGRTVPEQNALIYRYAHPETKWDRPPYLFAPAPSSGPNKSRHIDGKAIDADTVATNKAMWAEYGFEFLFPYDDIHVEYNSASDKHKADKPIYVETDSLHIKDDEMAYKIVPTRNERGVDTVRVFNTTTLEDVAIPGEKNGVNYLSLVKRFLNNDGSDVMLKAETDIVVGLLNQTK